MASGAPSLSVPENQVKLPTLPTRTVTLEAGATVTLDPLAPATASSLEQAWAAFSHERRAELWLEGRRTGDLRRWIGSGAGGAPDVPGAVLEDTSDRNRLCLPIATSETNSNVHLRALQPTDLDALEPLNPLYTGS